MNFLHPPAAGSRHYRNIHAMDCQIVEAYILFTGVSITVHIDRMLQITNV